LALPPEEAAGRLKRVISSGAVEGPADAAGSCVALRVAPDEQRLWSPHLTAQLYPVEAGSELVARFTPRPEVWTLLMMVYFGCAFVATCGAVYGCVQWLLRATPWALSLVPIGLAAIAALHVVSLIGQSLSGSQMHDLRARLEQIVDRAAK